MDGSWPRPATARSSSSRRRQASPYRPERIVAEQRLVEGGRVEPLRAGQVVEHAAERPAAVGRKPVQLGLGEPGRPLRRRAGPPGRPARATRRDRPAVSGSRSSARVTVDGTQPSVGVGTVPCAPPREPLVDLVEVVQRVVEHPPERLARGVGVAADAGRGGERSRLGVGEPGEQLVGHDRGHLAGGIVDGEPGEMDGAPARGPPRRGGPGRAARAPGSTPRPPAPRWRV